MLKRFSVLALVITAFSAGLVLEPAHANTDTNAALAAKARAKVDKMGKNAKVEVKLEDKTTVRGYISSVDQDSFEVVEKDTGAGRTITYDSVAEVKKPGGGLSMKSWIIIGAAAAGAIVTWIIVKPALCDGGAQTSGIC